MLSSGIHSALSSSSESRPCKSRKPWRTAQESNLIEHKVTSGWLCYSNTSLVGDGQLQLVRGLCSPSSWQQQQASPVFMAPGIQQLYSYFANQDFGLLGCQRLTYQERGLQFTWNALKVAYGLHSANSIPEMLILWLLQTTQEREKDQKKRWLPSFPSYTWSHILKKCPRTAEMAQGYCRTRLRYSSLTLQQGGCSPVNNAGLKRWVSAKQYNSTEQWARGI